jgi:hypothetical protein
VVCVNLTLLDDDGYRGEEADERIPDSGTKSVGCPPVFRIRI